MVSSKGGLLHKSTQEKYMGHRLALYSTVTGTSWVSIDGQVEGPFDTVNEAQARLERQKGLYKLAFYARSHRAASRRP
jgi:hypothetical protein